MCEVTEVLPRAVLQAHCGSVTSVGHLDGTVGNWPLAHCAPCNGIISFSSLVEWQNWRPVFYYGLSSQSNEENYQPSHFIVCCRSVVSKTFYLRQRRLDNICSWPDQSNTQNWADKPSAWHASFFDGRRCHTAMCPCLPDASLSLSLWKMSQVALPKVHCIVWWLVSALHMLVLHLPTSIR